MKDSDKLGVGLELAKRRYDKLRAIFEGIKKNAGYITDPGSGFPLKGISFAGEEGTAFRASFLDRTVQFRFLFDRNQGMGVVVVEDVSDESSDPADLHKVAVEIGRFTFNGDARVTAGLEPPPGDRDPYSLYQDIDCGTIILNALDSALDRDTPHTAVGFLT